MIAKFIRHLKKAERGQSIIILAFAFVVLLGFVGLTTDVSLMFVRYATIRRAVDSASLAAATQMRQGTEEAAVQIAAKQFVEFHGLDSVEVLVETCQTLDRQSNDPEVAAKVDELCTLDQRKLVKVTVQAESPTAFLRLLGWNNFTLQASAISETAALDVILIMDVSESMLTQTNYDDWAEIGMGWAFKPPNVRYDIAPAKGFNEGAAQTSTDPNDWPFYWANEIAGLPQAEVNARLWYNGIDDSSALSGVQDIDYQVEAIRLDNSAKYSEAYGFPVEASEFIPRADCRVRLSPYSKNVSLTAFPGRDKRADGSDSFARDVLAIHETEGGYGQGLYGENGVPWMYGDAFNGFVPTYNYYGCCNDPGTGTIDANGNIDMDSSTADFLFDDLICQPFKGARDAVELFLEKIDFIRGDRVAFVTFDRTAFLVNPWNVEAQEIGRSHMIEERQIALDTLRRVIGVRAEPNFYVWDDEIPGDPDPNSQLNANAKWGALAAGITRDASGISSSQGINYNDEFGAGYLIDHPGDIDHFFSANNEINYYYPVVGNCEFHNAALDAPYSTFNGSLGQVSLPYPENKSQTGDSLPFGGNPIWDKHPLIDHPSYGIITYDSDLLKDGQIAQFSYDLWASCRGTNIGAALREGNNALLDPNTSRRFGAIWVMVLLSDGAAGASDPVRRTDPSSPGFDPDMGGRKLGATLPYRLNTGTNPATLAPQAGEYGAFGVCPYGTKDDPGPVVDVIETGSPVFPYCSDKLPESRHECDFRPEKGVEFMRDADFNENPQDSDGNPIIDTAEILQWNRDRGNLYDVDIESLACTYYDVDDYARDWADYIALRDEDAVTEELLPTIYTIGFGLPFGGEGQNADPEAYVSDYLGEQMLRYIADVGDNNQLDNDYYQNYAEEGSVNEATVDGGYGTRGPCQTQIQQVYDNPTGYDLNADGNFDANEFRYMYGPAEPTKDCGNYFNAPNADQLEFVFDSIASKLFTRLTG